MVRQGALPPASDAGDVERTDGSCVGIELIPEQVQVEVPVEVTTTEEILRPVALYIILDNSLSMEEPLPVEDPDGPMTRWELAMSSLMEFVSSPASEGIDVAIQYFNPPDGERLDDVDLCEGRFHGNPDVDMRPLPGNALAILGSLEAAEPTGETPTVGALTGGIRYCQQFRAENADEECSLLLVTDGLPRGCGLCEGFAASPCLDPMSEALLVPIAEAGAAAGVRTYTVVMDGVPAEGFELMDAISRAGGTDCTPMDPGAEACNVSSKGSLGLIEALTSIRESVTVTETVTETMTVTETKPLDCQWFVPQTHDGEMVDPKRLAVALSLDGGEGELIPSVGSEADCAANDGVGWYYDDPANPTMIHACPELCASIQTSVNPSVQLLLDCAP